MDFSWDDLRLFLDVARLGGLSAATATTGLSAATLGRRITALERQLGEPLFARSQTGYRLTPPGEALLARAEDVETAMLSLKRWKEGAIGERVVRVSAGAWTSAFLASHIGALWSVDDRFGLELVTANEKVDIGRRNADLGIRNQRPSEQWLAGRLIGKVAYGLYSGLNLVNGIAAGYFVGIAGDGAQTQSARWMQARHGDRIAVRGNDSMSVRELVAAGAGLSVFPCFVGDSDPRLIRVAPLIAELETDQWLVSHHEERHTPAVRAVADRIGKLMGEHGALFRGERPGH
ncbi:Transcriptional regulator, LysR family [Devosia sp. LC5]|uniref:LysR family transcriptional regulator n=1 Tax=Devosia sp. LC5 TaxID=1502724 RepID=UPI0004E42234|nr:LysR family transcriptional regulator [Devosia sp. LC5]KFC64351.1 Transcriptional regulator, LysR family [Devosia sp. LC5]